MSLAGRAIITDVLPSEKSGDGRLPAYEELLGKSVQISSVLGNMKR